MISRGGGLVVILVDNGDLTLLRTTTNRCRRGTLVTATATTTTTTLGGDQGKTMQNILQDHIRLQRCFINRQMTKSRRRRWCFMRIPIHHGRQQQRCVKPGWKNAFHVQAWPWNGRLAATGGGGGWMDGWMDGSSRNRSTVLNVAVSVDGQTRRPKSMG